MDNIKLNGVVLGPYYNADKPELTVRPNDEQTIKVEVDKTSHKIEFENESETEVVVVIKPKEVC